ncbi:MAG: hypothetical protein RQ741_05030 [Wenzhouxiangellaceae bacterium]|nr:hypothetical protein [Wenzhouxiangellaceae bacterium]
MKKNETRASLVRYFAYTLFAFILMKLLGVLLQNGNYAWLFEHQPIEWLHFSLLLASVIVLWPGRGPGNDRYRVVATVLLSLAAFASLRELDLLLDRLIPVLGWKIAFVLPVFAIAYATVHRRIFWQAMDRFVSMPAFALFWSGFVIAVPLAQLLGHGPLLQALMGEDYIHMYKQVIEESAELIGYFVILAAAFEYRFTFSSER